jgi:hypothetical protein
MQEARCKQALTSTAPPEAFFDRLPMDSISSPSLFS